MNFLDGHLYPENQQPLIITAAPYAPGWIPSDFSEDIPITMAEQIQKAVDCYEAGAMVLHLHVREDDGKGSKRLSKFNELIAGVRKAVPEMIIQGKRPAIPSGFSISACFSRYVSTIRSRTRRH